MHLSLMTEETLTPAQLKRELRRIAWGQVRLAHKLGVWPSEVRDWLAGKRSEEHTSELQSLAYLVCPLLLEKKKSRRRAARPCGCCWCGAARARSGPRSAAP